MARVGFRHSCVMMGFPLFRRRSVAWQAKVRRELEKLGPTLELKQIGQLAAALKKLRKDLGKSLAFLPGFTLAL